jgi:hypothetical protein
MEQSLLSALLAVAIATIVALFVSKQKASTTAQATLDVTTKKLAATEKMLLKESAAVLEHNIAAVLMTASSAELTTQQAAELRSVRDDHVKREAELLVELGVTKKQGTKAVAALERAHSKRINQLSAGHVETHGAHATELAEMKTLLQDVERAHAAEKTKTLAAVAARAAAASKLQSSLAKHDALHKEHNAKHEANEARHEENAAALEKGAAAHAAAVAEHDERTSALAAEHVASLAAHVRGLFYSSHVYD